jgi:protein TonB
MNAHEATFYNDDRIGGAFGRSVAFHLTVVGALIGYAWWQGQGEKFGSNTPGLQTVSVDMFDNTIPIPTHGPENRLANETDNDTPQEAQPEKVQPKPTHEPEPKDAIAIKARVEKSKLPPLAPKSNLKPFEKLAQNQVTSRTPQAASDPLFGKSGGAQIGATDSALGSRFAAYAERIKSLTQQHWHKETVPSTAPSATVHFELQRDGSVRNLQLTRHSGNDAMDQSVLAAIQEASPYPPLPPDYDKSSATVEYTFRLTQ